MSILYTRKRRYDILIANYKGWAFHLLSQRARALRGWGESDNTFCGAAGTAGVEGAVEVGVEALCSAP